MDLEPTSDCGKRLHRLLRNWLRKCPETAHEVIYRVFYLYGLKFVNQKDFLRSVDRQKVLHEPLSLNPVLI